MLNIDLQHGLFATFNGKRLVNRVGRSK